MDAFLRIARFRTWISLILLIGASANAGAQSLVNASFEQPYLGTGYSAYVYNPAGTGWTFAGLSGIQANGSGWSGAWFSSFPGGPLATNGTQTAFLQSSGFYAGPSAISQTFVSSQITNIALTFDLAQRVNYGIGGTQTLDLLLDGQVIGSFAAAAGFTSYTASASNVAAGSHTFMFLATNLNHASDTAALIDNVQLTAVAAVPEPETYALMLAGLGLLGWSRRRRKS